MMKKTLFTLLLFVTVITANAFYDHIYRITMLFTGKSAIVEGRIFKQDMLWGLYYCFVPKDSTLEENNSVMKDLGWDFYRNMDNSDCGSMANNGYDYWQCLRMIYRNNRLVKSIEIEDFSHR